MKKGANARLENSKMEEFGGSHLQPTQPPPLEHANAIGSHTNHMLLLDVHHLRGGSAKYDGLFETQFVQYVSPLLLLSTRV